MSILNRKVVLFNLGAMALILTVFELVVRSFLPYSAPFSKRFDSSMAYRPSGFVMYHAAPNQLIYEAEGGIPDPRKVKYRINEFGYRGESIPLRKAEGEIRSPSSVDRTFST